MQRIYQIVGALLIVFAAVVAYRASGMRYYSSLGPGPGFFPFWIGIVIGILGLCMLLQATFGKPEPRPENLIPERTGGVRVASAVAALVVMTLVFEPVGFRLTMFALFLFLIFALGRQPILRSLVVAAIASFGAYHAFVYWLGVPLPVGAFGI